MSSSGADHRGPPGPPGPPGSGDKTFDFVQGTSSALWAIAHNLGKYPIPFVLDSANDNVEGLVTYVDVNNLTITFSAPFAGVAYLN